MSVNILEVQHLHFSYPDGTLVLKDLSVELERGKKIAILGANGTGKSTFLQHLIGVLKPNQGSIIYNGQVVQYNRAALQNLRSQVGFVFQDPDSQLFSASVWQEVSFGPVNLGWHKEKIIENVTKALQITDTEHLQGRPTHSLSYGQKKLITIAGVIAMEPRVIILDEPTASLDPQYTTKIIELLDQLNQGGTTVILATHDVDWAYAWADAILIMQGGRIVKEGHPAEIFEDDLLLKECSLSKPLIFEVFHQLQMSGYLPEGISAPRSKQKLFQMIGQFSGAR